MHKTLKEKALQIILERNLSSFMNDTKWRELRTAVMQEMPFPPPYIAKTLFENSCKEERDFQQDVWYEGDWWEGLGFENYYHGYFAFEWIKVRPRYLKTRGRLLPPEMIDASAMFEEILNRYQIPYVIENGMYCIYGYR